MENRPNNESIKEIDTLYEEILYAEDSDKKRVLELKRGVKRAIKYVKIQL